MITHLPHPLAGDLETLPAADDSRSMVCETAVAEDKTVERTVAEEAMVAEMVQLFKLLSDDTRLWILHYLSRAGELHVRALCDRLGQSQPAVSHHLALLRVAGLIQLRREGKHNFYRLEPNRFDEMLHSFFSFFPANDEGQIVFNGQALSYGPMDPVAT